MSRKRHSNSLIPNNEPAGAPRDHKPAGPARTITVQGVALRVDPSIFDDLDMLEDLYDLQNAAENPEGAFQLIPFLRRMCGDAYPKVKAALRDPATGRIPMKAVTEFMGELLEKSAPNS
ncbi:hypothetical protein DSM100688_0388 [Bifidobacterium ramosum]|uniref:Uncharacterized protein n=1 Tax=Bifidobacterium ramosum TaxID=1798158 RepID=A0A6L4X3J7_9BIFI|nr:hypothetical protein [Bifidobacterium ramosum]KAB8289308.1 hypothetical protein DSM100688_0388 [Bifidobacterium ramosum]NEG71012.1 hypothetical protein [Bifidobacterium ramosum]